VRKRLNDKHNARFFGWIKIDSAIEYYPKMTEMRIKTKKRHGITGISAG